MAYIKQEGQFQLKPVDWIEIEGGCKVRFLNKDGDECTGMFSYNKKDGSPNETCDLILAASQAGTSLLMEVKASADGKYFNAKWAVTPKAGSGGPGNPSFAELKKKLDAHRAASKAPAEPAYPADQIPF